MDKSSEDDLQLLEQYRQSFDSAYEIVRNAIREKLLLEATGRRKTTQSIIDKLRRESIRLTQIQDIAGCRLIAIDIVNQDEITSSLCKLFENTTIVDRRINPSYGYRAIHVIVQIHEKLIEVQIRTELQHLWAEFSEKMADIFGQKVKYGDGSEEIKSLLQLSSEEVNEIETVETVFRNFLECHPECNRSQFIELEANLLAKRQERLDIVRVLIKYLEKVKSLL